VRIAYLGPPGTFTEAALLTLPVAATAELVPAATITDALDGVRSGDVDAAVVPIENSVEGSVLLTLDELALRESADLTIRAEVSLAVTLNLLGRKGLRLADIGAVLSMPHAAAQCRRWLRAHVPSAEVRATTSTAEAARQVSTSDEPVAAIGAEIAAREYGLEVLAADIGDNSAAATRFVLVGRADVAPPPPTGADNTSVVAFIADDHPGALLDLLEEFAVRGVNLTRIESRPTGAGLGRYCFFVDCEGHVAEPRVGEALSGLRRKCADVRFLGSYPRADGGATRPPPGASADDFASAAEWLAAIRGR
jgi:prephenate dehydratase